jgi:hypothetical protein
MIPPWDVAQTGGDFAADHRLAVSDLAVRVSSPTAESECPPGWTMPRALRRLPADPRQFTVQVTAWFDA